MDAKTHQLDILLNIYDEKRHPYYELIKEAA